MQCVHLLKALTFAGEHRQYLVRATYLEIYQEEVRDLLSKNPNQRLEVKESAEKGVYVKGLVQFVVKSVAEINSVLQVCLACPSHCTAVYEVNEKGASSRPCKHTNKFCVVLPCIAMSVARAH